MNPNLLSASLYEVSIGIGYFEFTKKGNIYRMWNYLTGTEGFNLCSLTMSLNRWQHSVVLLIISGSTNFAISEMSTPYNVTRGLLHETDIFVSLTASNFSFTKGPT